MAIIKDLPGLEATIYTNGRIAKEYNDPSSPEAVQANQHLPPVTTKYIECHDDEPFRIRVKASKGYAWGYQDYALNFAVVIDGTWAKSELCMQRDVRDGVWERDIGYRVVRHPDDPARYIMQEFAFSSLIKVIGVTDEQLKSDLEKLERVGTIEVKVYRTTLEKEGPISVPIGEHPKDFHVSRDATKNNGQSHRTGYTRPHAATKPIYVKCSKLKDVDGRPIGIFRFKYRSREALKRVGITPEPDTAPDWLIEISDDEKIQAKKHKFTPIKRNSSVKLKEEALPEGNKEAKNIHELPQSLPGLNNESQKDNANLPRPLKLEDSIILPDFQLPRADSHYAVNQGGNNNTNAEETKASMADDHEKGLSTARSALPARRSEDMEEVMSSLQDGKPQNSTSVLLGRTSALVDAHRKTRNIRQQQTPKRKHTEKNNSTSGGTSAGRSEQRPRAVGHNIQGIAAPIPTPRGPALVIAQDKNDVKQDEHDDAKRLEERRQERYPVSGEFRRVSENACKEIDKRTRPPFYPGRTAHGSTPAPRGNYGSTVDRSTGTGSGISRQAATISTGKTKTENNHDTQRKRELSETSDSICLPRPFKTSKTSDGLDLIDLVDSD